VYLHLVHSSPHLHYDLWSGTDTYKEGTCITFDGVEPGLQLVVVYRIFADQRLQDSNLEAWTIVHNNFKMLTARKIIILEISPVFMLVSNGRTHCVKSV
jgi:hypothetical protein